MAQICSIEIIFQAFKEIQKLLLKTHGKTVGEVMTPSPLVVRESTNLEDAARYAQLQCCVQSSPWVGLYSCTLPILILSGIFSEDLKPSIIISAEPD